MFIFGLDKKLNSRGPKGSMELRTEADDEIICGLARCRSFPHLRGLRMIASKVEGSLACTGT